MGPPPATIPTPTSHCEKIGFSRLAKLTSHARVISLLLPVARPRMSATEATGKRVRRAGAFICVSLLGALIVAMGFSSATIEPEENGSRNWTMVLPILSYRPHRLMPEAYGFSRS